MTFIAALNFLILREGSKFFVHLKRSSELLIQKKDLENPLGIKIEKCFTEDKLYTREDLSLADLAKALKIPEYKLRTFINTELAYDNFRHFINSYRIQEAAECLNDPQNHDKILSIAFSVGFSSLAPFNKA